MKHTTDKGRLMLRVFMLLVIITAAFTSAMTSNTDSLRGVATALSAAWRSGGNAILSLDSDIKQGVGKAIDFTNEPYPPNNTNDDTFFTRAGINNLMGGTANLESFELLCGLDTNSNETSRVTDIVFWSQDYWEGTNQRFTCGPSNTPTYEISGTISNVSSFCVVNDKTSNARRLRCLNGPSCEDGRKNGNESDVDCGGSCGKCEAGQRCNASIDCGSGGTCQSEICQVPSCSDGVRNQNETDVDCGGSCADCSNGRSCSGNNDCQSGNCQSGTCEVKRTCSGAVAANSAQTFTVLVNLSDGCGGYATYFANTFTEAKGCASSAGHSVPSQMCSYDVLMETSPNWFVNIFASSTSRAVTCARNTLCSSCSPQVINTSSCVTQ
jgi:hypothetical protein